MNDLNAYTVHFETLGCKLNQIESESLAKCFADCGFSISMKHETAGENTRTEPVLCIINTCTVTAKAEQKARRLIRMLLNKFIRTAVIVTGCYAQVEPAAIEAIDPRVVVIPGTLKEEMADFAPYFARQFAQIENAASDSDFTQMLCNKIRSWPVLQNASLNDQAPETVKAGEAQKTQKKQNNKLKPQPAQNIPSLVQEFAALPGTGAKFKLVTDTFYNHSRASLKIQDGCSRHCSFCRICIARNKPVSLDAAEVLARALQIEQSGQREIVITGVNLSLYKSPNPFTLQQDDEAKQVFSPALKTKPFYDLADLLEYLLLNTKLVNFRISSLYPERVDENLCRIIKSERIRPHFHLSVQSGSDSILRAMHRPYLAKTVETAVENIRRIKPGAFIACDIIAGFPGESDEDFEKTKELCKKCCFTWIHAFPFSPRPGTEAYTMKNQVPQRIANDRVKWLCAEAEKNKKNYIQSFIGKEVTAIVEKRRTNPVRAVAENFLHLELLGETSELAALAGTEVRVKITAPKNTGLNDEIECTAVVVQ